MKDGNVNEFVDGLFRGSEWYFLFQGHKYFIQGWWENDMATLVLTDESEGAHPGYIWEKTSADMGENVKAFLEAPIWNKQKFWDAEKEMTWVD